MRKTIDKVVFIVETTFGTRDYNRFGIDVLIKNGFEVEVLDLTPYLKPKFYKETSIPDPVEFDAYKAINNKKELLFELLKNKNNSFIISIITYRPETYILYKNISKNKIPYGLFSTAVPYENNVNIISIPLFKKMANIVFNLSYSNMISYFTNYVPNFLLGLISAKYAFIGGSLSSTKMKLIGKNTEFIWIHAFDYDNYLDSKSIQSTVQNNYAVFLDQNLPFHSDFIHAGQLNPYKPDDYFLELNKAFDEIEKKFNLKIIISAHPRANKKVLSKYFKKRDVYIADTVNLVRDSEFCIAHWSYSINYAVLYKKPLLFLTSDLMKKSNHEHLIKSYSSRLGYVPLNISEGFKLENEQIRSISYEKYEQYERDFIKSDNSIQMKFWDAVSLTLSQYKTLK